MLMKICRTKKGIHTASAFLVIVLVFGFPQKEISVFFAEESSEETSSEIAEDIKSLEEQLSDAQAEYESLQTQLELKDTQASLLDSETEALRIKVETYRQAMSDRIAWFYENGTGMDALLEILFNSDGMVDMLSRTVYYRDICEYDTEQLELYEDALQELSDKEAELEETSAELQALSENSAAEKARIESLIESREEDLEAAEAAEKAAADAAAAAKAASSSSYTYGTSGGKLTKSKGVVYYNGHKETWYSQRVLPGNGLKIPGRHVNDEGLVCDEDGYICVASSDLAKGTLVETSLGMGKVYDCGCASGTIDIYTDW